MVTKVHLDALKSEASSIEGLLERIGERDILNGISLRSRLDALRAEIAAHEGEQSTLANVALIFDGEPVYGSSSIDAEFAGKALQNYQELIVKQVALSAGVLAERGPIPHDAHEAAKMHVTGLLHGSFGFILEEAHADEPALFDSPVKLAVEQVSDLLADVAAQNVAPFAKRLEEIDIRVFNTLKKFVGVLYKAKATMRVAEKQRELKFDLGSLGRAYERLKASDVSQTEEVILGELLGLIPIQRRFEFRRKDNGEIVKGLVSQLLSADYLERLDSEGVLAGREWRATVMHKSVEHPDGRHVAVTHMLTDLTQV